MRRQLSDDKTKRTVTSVSIVYWKQGVSIITRKVRRRFSKEKKRALSATRDFGTLYYEDRRPLYCATESHRTVSSGQLLGSPESRSEWSLLGASDARAEEEGGGVRSGPGAAGTILLFHTISARPPEHPRIGTYLPSGTHAA